MKKNVPENTSLLKFFFFYGMRLRIKEVTEKVMVSMENISPTAQTDKLS
jgi:hypothetical protein